MTAPLSAARLSPTAGLFNALLRLVIRGYDAYIAQLEASVEAARQVIRDSCLLDIAEAAAAGNTDLEGALREQLETREQQWAAEDGEVAS